MSRLFRILILLLLFTTFTGCRQKNIFDRVADSLLIDTNINAVCDDLYFPDYVDGITINWISDNTAIITNEGHVYRQEEDISVNIYAYLSNQNESKIYVYQITVSGLADSNDGERMEYVKRLLMKDIDRTVTSDLHLPTELNGVKISWISSKPEVIDNSGRLFSPATDQEVELFAYLSFHNLKTVKSVIFFVSAYNPDDWNTLFEVEATLLADYDLDNVTDNLTFPSEIAGVSLSWLSNKPNVIDKTGKVQRNTNDEIVEITVLLVYNSVRRQKVFSVTVPADNSAAYAVITAVKENLLNDVDLNAIIDNLNLEQYINGVAISWESNKPLVVSPVGQVIRQDKDCEVILTATLAYENIIQTKVFNIIVKARPSGDADRNHLESVKSELFKDTDIDNVTSDLYFPSEIAGVDLIWESDNPLIIDNEGSITRGLTDATVTITVYLEYNGLIDAVTFFVTVLKTEDVLSEYYRGAEGLSGTDLQMFLYSIIKNHTEYGYSSTTNLLKKTDEDPDNPNNVILFYTGRREAKSSYSYPTVWNKEHVWAKSHGDFGTAAPAGSDIHNLRPTDGQINSKRSNLDFDEGGIIATCNRGYAPGSSYSYYSSNYSFEPRDEVKGDVARILFYMVTRYNGNNEPDLDLNDKVQNGKASYHGRISVLLRWHHADPVDDFERNRNEVIYGYQKNRNPFIDYPHFVDLIWGDYITPEANPLLFDALSVMIADLVVIRRNPMAFA